MKTILTFFFLCFFLHLFSHHIPSRQFIAGITYFSRDKLKGRASGSEEIRNFKVTMGMMPNWQTIHVTILRKKRI